MILKVICLVHLISSQFLNLGGPRGTTYDVATIPFHPSLSSAALRESPDFWGQDVGSDCIGSWSLLIFLLSIPVHSLMLSSHHFFCLPLLLAPFTVPCKTVFAIQEDLEMWQYHLSFRFFTVWLIYHSLLSLVVCLGHIFSPVMPTPLQIVGLCREIFS